MERRDPCPGLAIFGGGLTLVERPSGRQLDFADGEGLPASQATRGPE